MKPVAYILIIVVLLLVAVACFGAVFTREEPKTYPDKAKWKYYVMLPEIIASENDPNSEIRKLAIKERAKLKPYIDNAEFDIADGNDHRYADGVIDDHDVNMVLRAKGADGRCKIYRGKTGLYDTNDPNYNWQPAVYGDRK